ncbi:MAG TPA: DUF2510 domain-containing protein [Acidimicrobiales bacterium]|nr:DUF2510 domain-containing protein [Acidimicrobiales bacterium]
MGDEGWYPDPYHPTHLRWWNGEIWSSDVRISPRATVDRTVSPFSASSIDPLLRHVIAAGIRPILHEAAEEQIIDERQRASLQRLVDHRCPPSRIAPPVQKAAVAPRTAVSPTPAATVLAPAKLGARTFDETRPPTPPEPAAIAIRETRAPSRFHRARSAVSSELAVHGLAYLGVLLLFAGVTGLTVFSTGDVRRGLRPVAELAAPTSLLFAAWFLRRRRSTVVAEALEVLAAAVLPIALLMSWIDSADIPPDPGDGLRIAVLAATCAALTVAYAWYAARRPSAPWRYFVAPLGWLTVATLALYTERDVPSADAVAIPVPWQWALVLVAIAATAAVVARFASSPTAVAANAELVPGAAVASVLALVAAGREGWTEQPLTLAGLALVIIFDVQRRWIRRAMAPLQVVAFAAALVPLVSWLGFGLAGMLGVAGAIVLGDRIGRRASPAEDVSIAAALTLLVFVGGAALAASATRPWMMILAFTALTVWAHLRRRYPPTFWAAPAQTLVVAALAPVGIGVGLARILEPGAATIAVAVATVGVAVMVRFRTRADGFWNAWVASAAALVVATSVLPLTTQDLRGRAVGGIIACLAIALASIARSIRLWMIAAGIQVPIALLGVNADLEPATIAAAVAVSAVLPVFASLRRTHLAGHFGLTGHTVALGASAVAIGDPRALTIAVWSTAIGAVITVVAQLTRGSQTVALLETALRDAIEPSQARLFAEILPAFAVSALFPLGLGLLLDWTHAVAAEDPWLGVAIAGSATIISLSAVLARSCPPVRWVFDVGSLIIALVAVAISTQELHSATVAVSVALVVTLLSRRPLDVHRAWLAWSLFGAGTVLSAASLDVPTDRLYLTVGAWGTLVALGTLWWDDRRSGRRPAGVVVRTVARAGPFTLGACGFAVAQMAAFGRPRDELGWVSLIGAAVSLGLTVMLRQHSLSIATWALAVVAGAALAPWDITALPWTLALAAFAPLTVAAVVERRTIRGEWWRRWDLPAAPAAAAISIVAILLALRVEQQPLTFACAGALCLAAAAWWRRIELAGVGALLVVVGAVIAGHGWGASALFACAVATIVAATRLATTTRWMALLAAVAATAGGWIELALFAEWDHNQTVQATALAGGGLAIIFGAAARVSRITMDWVAASAGAGILAVGIATALQADKATTTDARAQYAIATGIALVAAGLALLANRAPRLQLRELCAVTALGASAELGLAADATSAEVATVGSVAGFIAAAGLLVLFNFRPSSGWLRPLGIWGSGCALAAVVAGVDELPRRNPLSISLLIAASELAAAGIATRRVQLLQLAVAVTTAAWIVFASDELTGAVDWFSVPIGVALLCIVALGRADARRREQSTNRAGLVMVEFVAMGLIVGPAIAETVVRAPTFAAIAISGGATLATWGASTRVRRRLFFGCSSVILAVVTLIGIPVTRLVTAPRTDSDAGPIGLWLGLAAAGIVALAAAAIIEEGRRRVRRAVVRIGQLTDGWE